MNTTTIPIHVILARDEADGIGFQNSIPWKCTDDMFFFKRVTTETYDPERKNAVVVGYRTARSMPLYLSGRYVRTMNRDGTYSVPSDVEHVFLGGGTSSIRHYFESCRDGKSPWPMTLLLSRVPGTYPCDTYLHDSDLPLDEYELHATMNLGEPGGCFVDVYTKRSCPVPIRFPKAIFLMLSDTTNT